MTKFNQSNKGVNTTTNYEGSKSYKISPEHELYSLVVTSALSNKFYESSEDRLNRLKSLIAKCEPSFVAKLAVYTRESMYLRSIPLVVTVELNKFLYEQNYDRSIIKTLSKRVIQRADEITELLAYYTLANSDNIKEKDNGQQKKLRKMSKSLQKGVAESFHKFDEYQFSKYNKKSDIKLKDALFITHPKPQDATEEELFQKIANDNLNVPYTWETQLSSAKENNKTKKQVWEELIDSNKLGYMAMLRNLRNMLSEGISEQHVLKVAKKLEDKKAVQKSKQLPFRFLAAYKELRNNIDYHDDDLDPINSYEEMSKNIITNINHVNIILESLETAVQHSIENIKGFGLDTKVMIACDVSGSMTTPISPKSRIMQYDIGLILGMLLQNKSKNVMTGIFGDYFKPYHLPKNQVLNSVTQLLDNVNEVGLSTNGHEIINHLLENNIEQDKIMIFTDCQMWNSQDHNKDSISPSYCYNRDTLLPQKWNEYKKKFPKAKLYIFDLAGHGNTPIDIVQDDVYMISGWSEKVFEVLENLEKGDNAIKQINELKL